MAAGRVSPKRSAVKPKRASLRDETPFRSLVVNLSGQVQVVVLTAGDCRISEEPRCPEVVLDKGEAIETGPDDRNRQPKSRPATAGELSKAEKETAMPKN